VTDANANGTRKYKRDQLRRTLTFGAAASIALLAGLLLGYARKTGAATAGGLDPMAAAGLALLFVVGMVAANWIYLRNADELTWTNNVRASFWALMLLAILYPAWLILWTGGLTPAPDAETLYLVTLFSAGIIYLWKRFT